MIKKTGNEKKPIRILIMGKTPPPIGGVTIHLQRLLNHLENKIEYDFFNLNHFNSFKFLRTLSKYNVAHLHSSNVYLRVIFALVSKVFNIKSIITYHGNLGRFGHFKNFVDLLSLKLSYIPILINQMSYDIALKHNKNSKLISVFLPPLSTNPLPSNYFLEIEKFKKTKIIYVTNAYNLSFDEDGKEIYGLSQLLKLFKDNANRLLIIADPSSNYKKYIHQYYPDFINNAYWICEPIDFYELLKMCDGSIRNTTTDGDALSVRESLFLKKPTFASNVVDRPKGTITYNAVEELSYLLNNNTELSSCTSDYDVSNTINALLNCYEI